MRFDHRGNAIEYAMRIEWEFSLTGSNQQSTTGIQRILSAASQYRTEAAALLATANQKSVATREIRQQLAKDLFYLIEIELRNGSIQ